MSKDCQYGFSDFERSMVKRETKRERFLSVMEKEVPWEELEELLQPFYGNQDRTVGPPSLSAGDAAAHSLFAAVVLPQR